MGVTTATASVAPAPKPAVGQRTRQPAHMPHTQERSTRAQLAFSIGQPALVHYHQPRAMHEDVLSKLANRIAILGTIPLTTAPSPLYKPSGVSLAAICLPVAKKPRGLS